MHLLDRADVPTIDSPPAANDNAVFDRVERKRRPKRIYDPIVSYRPGPSGTPIRLVFSDEDGSGVPLRAGRRQTTQAVQQMAAEGTPLDIEFRDGRLPAWLRDDAEAFARVYERANRPTAAVKSPSLADEGDEPSFGSSEFKKVGTRYVLGGHDIFTAVPDVRQLEGERVPARSIRATPAPEQLAGIEIRVQASQVCRLIASRCAHLYRDLVDAAVMGATMKEIGARHGGNANDSAKLGREKVRDALLFAHAAFDDLMRWEVEDGRAMRRPEYIQGRLAKAIGESIDIPAHWHRAANDDVRRTDSVAA
jgi:hypothetical protein